MLTNTVTHTHTHTHTHIYIYIYIHTHTHTLQTIDKTMVKLEIHNRVWLFDELFSDQIFKTANLSKIIFKNAPMIVVDQ